MQESKLSVVCERVLDRCLAPTTAGGEGCDNMTMIIVQFVQLKKPLQSAGSADERPSPTEETGTGSDSKAGESEPK